MLNLKPKRRLKESALERLYPYYAGFSLDFAMEALKAINLKTGSLILDPWNGAGTATCAASKLGFDSIGIDLNPAVCLVAKARLALLSGTVLPGIGVFDVKPSPSQRKIKSQIDPLLMHLTPRSVKYVRAIVQSILSSNDDHELASINIDVARLLPGQAVSLTLLMNSVKALSPKTTSNPTWMKAIKGKSSFSPQALISLIEQQKDELQSALKNQAQSAQSQALIQVGDARSLAFVKTNSVDGVLTSPPYCTRIDYARATSFELAFLGIAQSHAEGELRYQLMGTTAIRRGDVIWDIPTSWPAGIQLLLASIREHSTYAARRYYFRNFRQYFEDAIQACAELTRVTKADGQMIIVTQNSFFKDIEIKLPTLYSEIFENLGCKVEVIATQRASKFFSSINPKARARANERNYAEVVLRIVNAKKSGLPVY